jgi:SP family myo-inositol transporter-like MFS transporter 13
MLFGVFCLNCCHRRVSIADRFGRKPTLIIADVIFVLGAILMAIAPEVVMLIIGRLVVGVGVGFAAMVVPIYLAETSPMEYRGAIVSTNILLVTSG